MSIAEYAKLLQKREVGFFDIPEEYRQNKDIVSIERKLGIRTSGKRGFDIIRNRFFVKETVVTKNFCNEVVEKELETIFFDFHSYYEFLNGDIYENACYYQYNFTQEELSVYHIDLSKINVSGFIDYTIKSVTIELPKNNLLQYEKAEAEKNIRKQWIEKFNKCKTYEQFYDTIKQFNTDYEFSSLDLHFYIFNFIFLDSEKAFDIIMQYISEGNADWLANDMCIIYNPQRVLESYNYNCGTYQTNYRHKKRLKEFIKKLEKENIYFKYSSVP